MSVSSQLAHLQGTVCLSHSATLILPPLLTLPSRCTYLVTISKLFHSHAYPLIQCVCVCVCMGGGGGWVSFMLLQKHPVLQPCAVDWHSIKPLYYYCHKILLGLVTWKYEDQQHYVYNLNIRFSASWMYFSLQMKFSVYINLFQSHTNQYSPSVTTAFILVDSSQKYCKWWKLQRNTNSSVLLGLPGLCCSHKN